MIFSEAEDLSQVQINFSDENVGMMNVCLAIIMFSVAISINVREFREVLRNPRGVLTGLASQLFLFPLLTFFLVLFLRPEMGLALGLILIGACPGGNISNFFSLQSGGNVALSVSLTVVVTLLAPVMTPFNFEFWGSRVTYLEPLFSSITIDYLALAKTVFLIMVAPLIGGGLRPDGERLFHQVRHSSQIACRRAEIVGAGMGMVRAELLRQPDITRQRVQHMLPWPDGRRVAHFDGVSGLKCLDDVGHDPIGGVIATADHISRSCSRQSQLALCGVGFAPALNQNLGCRLGRTVEIMATQPIVLAVGVLPLPVLINLVGGHHDHGCGNAGPP